MKNWLNYCIGVLFLIMVTFLLTVPAFTAEKGSPKVQATPSGDVKVSYYEGVKGVCWSSKYGIDFEVGPEYNIWSRELITEENPYGEFPPEGLQRALLAPYGTRIVVVREPDGPWYRYMTTLRFREGQLSEDEIRDWVEGAISTFRRSVARLGFPERGTPVKIQINGVTATKVDYTWRNGRDSLVVTFRTEKGTCFFYFSSRARSNFEPLSKTIKFVK